MYWYRFELTADQIEKGGLVRMEKQFEERVVPRSELGSVCLLREWQPYDDGAVFYICAATPVGDEALSRLFFARLCEPPSMSSIRFWSGDVSLNESLKTADNT
jgi:predicted carbohydrate-binding protein with CBM5 and CBM33 domain